jgi:phosphatidylserine decarboxylase
MRSFQVRLTAFDWDKLSSNDYISEAAFNVNDLVADAPQPLPLPEDNLRAGSGLAVALPAFGDITAVPGGSGVEARERGIQIPLYAEEESGDHPMKEFKLKLEIGAGGREPVLWESKHSPMITFR